MRAQPFTFFDPAWCWELTRLQCSCLPILEYFSCRFRSVVYTVVKQGLCSQMFTVCVFSSPFPSFLITALFFFFSAPTALPLPFYFPTCILSSSSPSLHISSTPSGGSVASDAAGRRQPFITVTGGNLQTTLRQEGHRTWQPHFQILRSSGDCAGQRHAGQPPGMEMVIVNRCAHTTAWYSLHWYASWVFGL